jgi:cytochrome c556
MLLAFPWPQRRAFLPPFEEHMKTAIRLALFAVSLCAAASASAQFAKPEDAYKYRASVMYLQSQHLGRINAQLKSDKPDLARIAENAAILDTLNGLFFAAFPPGSDMVASSRAKPEIWKDQGKFKQNTEQLNADVAKLLAAAKGGDLAATRSSFQAVARDCKGCHDEFRRD